MNPQLSVIIVVGRRRDRATHCLSSVLAQSCVDRLEVLLCDIAPRGTPPLPGSDHPAVHRLILGERVLFGAARRAGVEAAQAPVVAFLEEHVWTLPGWGEVLLKAHRGPWAGIGPQVELGNPGIAQCDTTFALTYALFAPPQTEGEAAWIAGHNSSYRRAVLLAFGDQLEDLLKLDNLLMARLRADGHRLAVMPQAQVAHLNEAEVHSLARAYFHYHRMFGEARARTFHWPWWRRLVYIVLTPVMPFYFLVRYSRLLRRRDSPWWRQVVRRLGSTLSVQGAGAVGQALGLLFGPGDSEVHFSRHETEAERPLPIHIRPA